MSELKDFKNKNKNYVSPELLTIAYLIDYNYVHGICLQEVYLVL